jgi:hypothetical protein
MSSHGLQKRSPTLSGCLAHFRLSEYQAWGEFSFPTSFTVDHPSEKQEIMSHIPHLIIVGHKVLRVDGILFCAALHGRIAVFLFLILVCQLLVVVLGPFLAGVAANHTLLTVWYPYGVSF